MTVSSFVETKFIPEHVHHKRTAGQTHYKAILKHLLKPETVNRIFQSAGTVQPRLQALSDWPYLDNVRLCDFTTEHVRRLVSAAFDSHYSWQTVKHIKNVTFTVRFEYDAAKKIYKRDAHLSLLRADTGGTNLW